MILTIYVEEMLRKFCELFADLFDVRFMRLNVHQLLHLPDSAKTLGPLNPIVVFLSKIKMEFC